MRRFLSRIAHRDMVWFAYSNSDDAADLVLSCKFTASRKLSPRMD